ISQCATASRGQRYVKKNKPAPPTSIYKAAVHRCARAVRRSGNVNADRHAYGPDRQPGRAGLRAAKGVRCERNSDSRKT
ncbi:MAG TPA: hypothetical protein VG820_11315, partial [Fimbriimonadaceae bacterium]|nr:hypothetical protein [Fimbriimonadaceae bacterium]